VDASMVELPGIGESNVFKWMQDNRYLSHIIDYKPISMPDYKRFKLKAAEVDYVKKFQDLNETALARLSLDEDRNMMIVEAVSSAIMGGSKKYCCSLARYRIVTS
jgi:hypothetical protein